MTVVLWGCGEGFVVGEGVLGRCAVGGDTERLDRAI